MRHWKPLLALLLLGMPAVWLIASGLAAATLGLPILGALLLGAVVTPTDPVLADAIVTGELAERSIHERVRHLISAEAGANDGLAFLLVMLPILLMQSSPGVALSSWLVDVLLREVLLALAVGTAAGLATGWVVRWGLHGELMGGTPLLAVSIALAVALLGGVRLLHADGLIAVFAAGIALNWMSRGEHDARQERVQDAITRFFDQPVFVLLGMTLPFAAWVEYGFSLVAFAVLVLLLRRLPVVFAIRRFLKEAVHDWRDAAFVGWFGPIGAAALVYAAWADVHADIDAVWTIGSFVVTASVVLHGITATPATQLYRRAQTVEV